MINRPIYGVDRRLLLPSVPLGTRDTPDGRGPPRDSKDVDFNLEMGGTVRVSELEIIELAHGVDLGILGILGILGSLGPGTRRFSNSRVKDVARDNTYSVPELCFPFIRNYNPELVSSPQATRGFRTSSNLA